MPWLFAIYGVGRYYVFTCVAHVTLRSNRTQIQLGGISCDMVLSILHIICNAPFICCNIHKRDTQVSRECCRIQSILHIAYHVICFTDVVHSSFRDHAHCFWRKQKFNRGTVSGSMLCKSKAFVTSISTQNKPTNKNSILLWNIASIKSIMTSQEVRNLLLSWLNVLSMTLHKSSIVCSIIQ